MASNLRPVVFCGPSGVGKGTLIDMLMKTFPNGQFGFSVSHTTRKPREGEQDGVHYNFTTVEKIQEDIVKGLFIEYAEVHGRYYGTSFAAVESVQSEGKVCILDIDVQGVQNVKKSTKIRPHYIFVAPPSMAELEKRLRGRGTEKEEDIQRRLKNSSAELDYGKAKGNFDVILVNDDLQKTFATLVRQIKTWYPHLTEKILPKPLVICTPSGMEKGALFNLLMERFPNGQFGLAVKHTTREPRQGETDGIDYHFVSEATMKKDMEAGLFLEYSEKDEALYGTSLSAVESIRNDSKICILDTNVVGVQMIKRGYSSSSSSSSSSSLDPNYMFVAPLSMEVLEQQLRKSGKSEDEIKSVLSTATSELEYGQVAGNFDRIFIMADLGAMFESVVHSLKEWYPQLTEMAPDDPHKTCTCTIS